MRSTALNVRLFNGGAGRPGDDGKPRPLNMSWFNEKVAALETMLSSSLVERIVVANNRDPDSKFGEAADDNGDTPTGRAIKDRFSEYGDRVNVVYVAEWGNNAGSGRAVQAGIDHLTAHSAADTFMVWSPELEVTPERLAGALGHMTTGNHDVVGFVRQNWQNKPQWMIPQHTGFIGTRQHWSLAAVPQKADGDEGRTIQTEAGEAPVAGMDDFCRLLEVMKKGQLGSIGMYGKADPLPWVIDWNDERQIQKIARQWGVALTWAQDAYADRDPKDVMNEFFKHISIN